MPHDPGRHKSTRLSVAQLVDGLCDDFEAAWRSGERPQIDAFLAQAPDSVRILLFRELLALELEYRVAHQEVPREQEYRERFPEFVSLIRDTLTDTVSVSRQDIATSEFDGPDLQENGPSRAAQSGHRLDPLPAQIGKYRVISRLGAGGQGEVYRAIHPQLDRDVVIKLARFREPASQVEVNRLVAEGKVLAELDHPNLARVYDLDFYDDYPYLVMEYVRGLNLRQYAQQKSLSPKDAALLVAQVALAAAVAHERGVIHQDIKPENVIVDADGNPHLIDFGLARLRHAWREDRIEPGSVAGTASYMAPEQARGETELVDQRSDVFALGSVLYFLLAGHAPFQGKNFQESLARASACQFDRSALDRGCISKILKNILLSALEPEIEKRCPSAKVFAKKLGQFAARRMHIRQLMVALCGAVGALVLFCILAVVLDGGDDGASGGGLPPAQVVLSDGEDGSGNGPSTIEPPKEESNPESPTSEVPASFVNQPVAAFTGSPNPAACNQGIAFDGSGCSHGRLDRSIVLYEWDFDYNGHRFDVDATGVNVTHSYSHFGSYTAALRVTDDNEPAKTAIDTEKIDVSLGNRAPVADGDGPLLDRRWRGSAVGWERVV